MKLKTKFFLKAKLDDKKIIRKFLWFPTYFGEEKTCRWLEFADVVYRVVKIGHDSPSFRWRKVRFATDEDYKSLPFEKSEFSLPGSLSFLIVDVIIINIMMLSEDIYLSTTLLLAAKITQVMVMRCGKGNGGM